MNKIYISSIAVAKCPLYEEIRSSTWEPLLASPFCCQLRSGYFAFFLCPTLEGSTTSSSGRLTNYVDLLAVLD